MAGDALALGNRPRQVWLWAEFSALYLGTPLAIALLLPPGRMFTALLASSFVGLALLWRTGGFHWRSLVRGWRRVPWVEAGLIAAAVFVTGLILITTLRPEALFFLLRQRPEFMAVIWVLYPFLSALPQELVFRALFFHRYGTLLPAGAAALWINAAVFSLAHLMYWSPIVMTMTFAGGFLFARAYLTRGFPAAWVLHAVAGNVIFAVGLGAWFYSGAVVRPF